MIADAPISIKVPDGSPPPLRLVSLHDHRREAATLFYELAHDESAKMFRPHPLTAEHAYSMSWSRDVYVLAIDSNVEALAYGMLRGWDEGFEIPSLGIALCRAARGTGISKLLMQHLHVCARLRGARQIRLSVYPENTAAIRLYQSLGYEFYDEGPDRRVGLCSI
jgi:ribosomal-protein-alanine N-acetyltransferase